jgi:hypothetical protein
VVTDLPRPVVMGRLLSRVVEIAIEDPDPLRHPPERLRSVRQIVPALLAFLIEADLAHVDWRM